MAGTERCARCGAGFECGMEAGAGPCWCADLPPVMAVTDEGCLCPRCLAEAVRARVGRCLDCSHARRLKSKGGGALFMCRRAEADAAYPKFPRLPVQECRGYQATAEKR